MSERRSLPRDHLNIVQTPTQARMGDNLRGRVLNGTKWTVVAQVGQQAARFVLSIVLARLLLPNDFGTVGMVAVFAGFANWIGDMGLSAALIQRSQIDDRHAQTVFWLNMATALVFSATMFVSAPLLAGFYDQPQLAALTRALSFSFLVSAPGMVPAALLQRRMGFRYLARTSILGTVVSGITGICLAYFGAGVWSLVAQTYAHHFVTTALNTLWAGWRPRWGFHLHALKDLWRFSVNLLGYSSLNYWAKHADHMIIGRFMGSAALGFYGRVHALMLMPMYQIVNVINRVMFPALSSIQDDPARVKRIYLQALSVIALITSPLMFGLTATAEPFVLAVYGKNWAPMIPLVQILPLVGLLQAFTGTCGILYMSQGRTDWMFRWGLITSGAMITSILAGIAIGTLEAVAWCYAAANVLLFYPSVAIPGSLIGLKFSEVVRTVTSPMIGSVLMLVGVTLVYNITPATWPYAVELLMLVLVGAVGYTTLVLITRPLGLQQLLQIARERFPQLNGRALFRRASHIP